MAEDQVSKTEVIKRPPEALGLENLAKNYRELNQKLEKQFPGALEKTDYGLLLRRQWRNVPVGKEFEDKDILFTE